MTDAATADALRPTGAGAFTPGPWHVETTEKSFQPGRFWHEIKAVGAEEALAEVYDGGVCAAEELPALANARLMAAAPDLCEALAKAEHELTTRIRSGLAEAGYAAEEISGIVDACPAIIDARAALAKARGEQ